jgi:hypothetical protein
MPPRGVTSAKRKRQYEHVKESELERGVGEDRAEEIAARTVNKQRVQAGETKGAAGRKTSGKRKTSGGKKASAGRKASAGNSKRGRNTGARASASSSKSAPSRGRKATAKKR